MSIARSKLEDFHSFPSLSHPTLYPRQFAPSSFEKLRFSKIRRIDLSVATNAVVWTTTVLAPNDNPIRICVGDYTNQLNLN